MCTVTYIPQVDGFILSSNRDESPKRSDNNLAIEEKYDQRLLYPKDSKGGSWLIATDTGRVACLLNGAFDYHKHQPPYKMSRGIMLKEVFKYPGIGDFLRAFDLINIEPFTVIVVEEHGLYEVRWDGKNKFARTLDQQKNYVWSSSTLYTPEMQKERARWFEDAISGKEEITLNDIKHLHRNGGKGNQDYGYIMNRENRVCTISITHVISKEKESILEFENTLSDEIQVRQINHKKKSTLSAI